MKLNKMTKEELETYSYIDLARMIILESRKKLNTLEIFKKICKLLDLPSEECENKIGDFYTDLTTDKTFILLEDGTWDLSSNHSRSINIDDSEEDEELTETEEELEEELDDMAPEEYHEMDDDANVEDSDLDDIDEIDDEELTIVDEDELE